MAQFELKILSNNADEFESLCARFLGSAGRGALSLGGAGQGGSGEEDEDQGGGQPQSDTEAAGAPVKPKRTRKAKAGAEPTQEPSGEPIPPATAPTPQPTPGGTEAPPAESIPPNQEPAKDIFSEQTSATPSASSPEADAAAAAGQPTMQQLKDAMAELLKVKSAAFAMKTLEDATGCKSLSSGSPSVAEKAKTEPAIMKTALDALVAGKTAV